MPTVSESAFSGGLRSFGVADISGSDVSDSRFEDVKASLRETFVWAGVGGWKYIIGDRNRPEPGKILSKYPPVPVLSGEKCGIGQKSRKFL